MSLYLFGPLIKQRREELGYTQEDLADGICSVPTLSRIENGERLPNKRHSEMLLQRLGYSDSIIINYVDEKTPTGTPASRSPKELSPALQYLGYM